MMFRYIKLDKKWTLAFLITLLMFVSIHKKETSAATDPSTPLIRIFTGYDSRAAIGHHVCEQSIMKHSSLPVSITPLYLSTIKRVFTRKKSPTQLTDFTYSRFIVPHLCGYKGWAIFMDGNDMILREDIAKLWALRDDRYAVMVVKHPEFKDDYSFMGKSIPSYPMLNWSSMMLINCEKCTRLTPEYVNTADYYELHQFKWLESQELIGKLPNTWNHLVGYCPSRPDAALVHWTLGAPYQGGEFAKTEHAEEWFKIRDEIISLL